MADTRTRISQATTTHQSDVVINASGVRTGAATTVIRTIKRSATVGTDRASAFFMMRMDISVCNRDRQVSTRAQEDKNSRTLLQQFAFCQWLHVNIRPLFPLSHSFSLSFPVFRTAFIYPSTEGCVCVHPDTKLRVFGDL